MRLSPAERWMIRSLLRPGRPPSRAEVEEFQAARLREIVAHAYQRVPFYRRLFDRHGLTPDMIRTPADLTRVPVTTRREVQAASPADLVAEGEDPARLLSHSTGGSSGVPLTIRRGRREDWLGSAQRARMLRSFGVRPRDRRVGVRLVERAPAPPHPMRRVLRALGYDRRTVLTLARPPAEILAAMRRLRPDVLLGYPNALARLARLATPEDRAVIRPRLAICGAEVVTPDMRAAITAGFGARVFDWYGSQELGLVAWECRHTGAYHVADDAIALEVLRDGRPTAPGESGEVVGTRLHSRAMPFIRYAQDDVVTRGAGSCACGQPWSTIHTVEGRMRDFFLLPSGRLVHPLDLNYPLKLEGWIKEYRFVQDRRDRVRVQMVAPAPPPEGVARITDALIARLEPGVALEIELVSRIELEAGGKFRMARSLVDPDYDGIDWAARRAAEFPRPGPGAR